jgi:hypothetical protein
VEAREREESAHIAQKKGSAKYLFYGPGIHPLLWSGGPHRPLSPRLLSRAHLQEQCSSRRVEKPTPKKNEKVRERENQGSTAMHDGKEKERKQKEKVGYF